MQAGTALIGRRLLAAFVAVMLMASVMLLFAESPARAASVTPEFIPGASNSDKTCAANEGTGQDWIELKVDPPGGGTYGDGTLSVTITNYTSNSFDWSSNIGVDAVIVKTGQDGANLYRYDPPSESTGDTNLVTPGNNATSHISFCYDLVDPTTTTTEAEETTTTQAEETTTTQAEATTTTLVDTTTTTIGDEVLPTVITTSTTAAPTTTAADEVLDTEVLPFTGSDNDMLALLAGGLGLLGTLVLASTRRMEEN